MNFKKTIQLLFILILLYLSLFAGPGYHQTRSLEALWNLGHILLFALLTYFLLEFWPWLRQQKQGRQFLFAVLITLILGVGIELIQALLSSGTPDPGDVFRDFLGCTVPFIFNTRIHIKNGLRLVLRIILILLFVVELAPAGLAAIDEYRAQNQFPVLSDFESRLELSRWDGDAHYILSNAHTWHGKKALKIHLTTELYSGVSLVYLPSDWSGYKTLHFNVYDPDNQPLTMTCRIHDALHVKNGQHYSDRFNKQFALKPGWNEITMDLREVQNAPKGRAMDLTQIINVAIFATRLQAARVLYLDYIYLSKE